MGLFIPHSAIREEGHTDRDLVGSTAGRGWGHSQQDGGNAGFHLGFSPAHGARVLCRVLACAGVSCWADAGVALLEGGCLSPPSGLPKETGTKPSQPRRLLCQEREPEGCLGVIEPWQRGRTRCWSAQSRLVWQSLKPSSDTQNTPTRAGSWGTPHMTRLRGFPGQPSGITRSPPCHRDGVGLVIQDNIPRGPIFPQKRVSGLWRAHTRGAEPRRRLSWTLKPGSAIRYLFGFFSRWGRSCSRKTAQPTSSLR